MEILLLAIFIGLIPAFVASSKGRSFVGWWIYGALLFIVALPHALLMEADPGRSEREAVSNGSARKCPFCAELIRPEARVCRYCSRDLGTAAETESDRTNRLIQALERNRDASANAGSD